VPSHCWLHCWEEAIGTLEEIWIEDSLLRAKIGRIIVVLPSELEGTLYPLLSHKIAILHTDIPGKEYLVRIMTEDNSPIDQTDMVVQTKPKAQQEKASA